MERERRKLWIDLTETVRARKTAEALAMAKLSTPIRSIAVALGMTHYMVSCIVIPGYREREQDRTKDYNIKAKKPVTMKPPESPAGQIIMQRHRAAYFHDNRPFTARFMGDPAPGRSALDQKGFSR